MKVLLFSVLWFLFIYLFTFHGRKSMYSISEEHSEAKYLN